MTGNVVALLHAAAARVPERPALVLRAGSATRRVTFAELSRAAGAVAAGLRRRGLRPGDRVVVFVPMSAELYAVLVGVLQAGAAAVFVDPWMDRRRVAALAALAEPAAFLGTPRSHLLRLLEARLRGIPIAVTTGRRFLGLPAGATLAELLDETPSAEIAPRAAGDPALVTFTSGSSGHPKGANRTHGFLAAQHAALAEEFPLRPGDVELTTFPVFALHNLASGVTTVVPPIDLRDVGSFDAAAVAALMAAEGVTTCTASPPFLDRLAEHWRGGGEAPASLRRVVTGGAPVSDAQLRRWSAALPRAEILVAYGSTEAEPVAHVGAAERLAAASDVRPRTPGYCLGRPSARLRTRILRIHDGPIVLGAEGWGPWEVLPGEIGELVVAGAHVCRSYYRGPEAERAGKIADAEGDVWHRMGDTVYRDGGGRLWLAGRVHSTIRRGGVLLHAQLVEQAARGGDERVRAAAALGLPDPDLGERLVVVLEAEADDGLEGAARERLRAAGCAADELRVTPRRLPRDPRHRSKIDYRRLEADLAGGRVEAAPR